MLSGQSPFFMVQQEVERGVPDMQSILTNLGAVTPDEAEETLQTVTDFLKGLNL